jgi:hypothetical protein
VVRSLNVAHELFRQGVALERGIVIGYGDTRPLQPAEAGQKVDSRRALVRRQMPPALRGRRLTGGGSLPRL